MDEVREYTFEELRRIVKPIAESYGMRQVYLFGSRARGDNREDSDYDFCVVTSDDCDLFELGGFFAELRDALGVEIDLVCQESLRDDFSREVARDGMLLYGV
ncbi:MAG: nucleotidyltransferase domain-containing protein [Candidatus Methanomethylophilaceae archaeon]|nr:nucleotidyltransferase domain-containing protein [Candidatus Methanomethylophilaceae archaeon]